VDALVGIHLDEESVAGTDADEVGLDVADLDVATAAGALARGRQERRQAGRDQEIAPLPGQAPYVELFVGP
jgi:hypothetical protein